MTEPAILVRAIVTQDDHEWAIHRITYLIESHPADGTPEDHELEALITLVERYEEVRFPMNPPNPISIIAVVMEQKGLTRKDLEPMIGSRARVSEVLSGKRRLTLGMIRRLHEGLGIPLERLISPDIEGLQDNGRRSSFRVRQTAQTSHARPQPARQTAG